jgi:hypothetical protein
MPGSVVIFGPKTPVGANYFAAKIKDYMDFSASTGRKPPSG